MLVKFRVIYLILSIFSVTRNGEKFCGFDFYEANAGEEGVPRWDLNGTHSSLAFEEAIEERLSILSNDEPLFTYMSLKAPHGPLQPKQHFLDMYRDVYGLDPGKNTIILLTENCHL